MLYKPFAGGDTYQHALEVEACSFNLNISFTSDCEMKRLLDLHTFELHLVKNWGSIPWRSHLLHIHQINLLLPFYPSWLFKQVNSSFKCDGSAKTGLLNGGNETFFAVQLVINLKLMAIAQSVVNKSALRFWYFKRLQWFSTEDSVSALHNM